MLSIRRSTSSIGNDFFGFFAMTDPFNGPKMKIGYANDRIRDLDLVIKQFLSEHPYARMIENDSEAGLDRHKVKFRARLPARVSFDVSDICHQIRSVLDQIGWATSRLIHAKGNCTYFPFARSEGELQNVIARRCKHLPPDIVTLFRSFRPYKGGDDLLWSVNEAANSDKHRIVRPCAAGGDAMCIITMPIADIVNYKECTWDWENDEIYLFDAKAGSKPDYELRIKTDVVFGDVGTLQKLPVVPTLVELVRKVDAIGAATEAECRRLGLIP